MRTRFQTFMKKTYQLEEAVSIEVARILLTDINAGNWRATPHFMTLHINDSKCMASYHLIMVCGMLS